MISPLYTTFCDGPDDEGCPNGRWCGSTLSEPDSQQDTPKASWAVARRAGWKRRRVKGRYVHLCPECLETLQGKR